MLDASPVSPTVSSQLIETTLRAAAGATGMQLVFVSSIADETLTWRALHGDFDGITAGSSQPLEETFCGRLLKGAPPSTSNADADPAYRGVFLHDHLGATSYVGVPLYDKGVVTGTLGALDAAIVVTAPETLTVIKALARLISRDNFADPDVRLRRTSSGWEVQQTSADLRSTVSGIDDLTVAMSLADLIVAEAGGAVPPQRPQRAAEDLAEPERLRLQITQLEHALSARVVIEQAIGVMAQRFSVSPRDAFDRLRKAARSRGQRVHDLSVSLVLSARDRTISLPPELREPDSNEPEPGEPQPG